MTRRRNPPPRRPNQGPGRPGGKDKDQLDSELRLARAVRKAQSLQKQRLRRGEWDTEVDDLAGEEPVETDLGDALQDDLDEVVGTEDEDRE